MRLLLDTPVLVWWLKGDSALPGMVTDQIAEPRNQIYFSTATIWEMTLQRNAGDMMFADDDLNGILDRTGFGELSIKRKHVQAAYQLPPHHDNIFDRLLIAQGRTEQCEIVTFDRLFKPYGIPVLRA